MRSALIRRGLRRFLLIGLLAVLLAAGGCRKGDVSPTVEPTASTMPTAVAEPTVSPQPTPTLTPTPAPKPTPKPKPKPVPTPSEPEAAIVVLRPAPGQSVTSPFRVSGTADVFEAQFNLRLVGANGKVITEQQVKATSGSGTRGTYSVMVAYPASARGNATLEVFDISEKDGSVIDLVKVPLVLR
jgi:outer membrane biosynthesis protein TonB